MERSTIIRKLMEDRGMKVSDISKDSGIAYSTVKSILENGTGKASYVNICKICKAVGITADKLEDLVKNNKSKEPELSKEDYEIIRKYKFISTHSPDGANVVDMVLDREHAIAEKLKEQNEHITKLTTVPQATVHNTPMRLINYYYRLASAGTGQIIFDMPPTKRIEIPNIPEYRKADYAIGVNGNSMEPIFHDGDTLLIEMADEIESGEIGIFMVDNESYVKKLGKRELISLNPEYDNIPLTENSKCMGKVIGKLNQII